MQDTYLFYDIETSGLSPCFDQVYQFAAIRTDLELNELARYNYEIKPTRGIIPAPEAMITHRLSFSYLEQKGESEYTAICKIHALLNEPGTISLGYNTLSFDDEFLRFSFYRHLLTPYTHQFANRCRRMDVFPMLIFYYLFRPASLKWPEKDGQVSLKLDSLTQLNQLAEGQSHHAMVDVEATLALAKMLKQDAKMWAYVQDYFVKQQDESRLAQLPQWSVDQTQYVHGVMVDSKFGYAHHLQAPVLCLGQHWHYKNQSIWLRLDDSRLLSGDLALLPEIWAIKKRLAEAPFVLLPEARFIRFDPVRQSLANEVLAYFQAHPHFFAAVRDYFLDYKYPDCREADVEAALYLRGFLSDHEALQLKRFHALSPSDQAKFRTYFKNPDLQTLALRHFGRFAPEYLTAEDQLEFEAYLQSTPVDYQARPKLTAAEALQRIDVLLKERNLDPEQNKILQELQQFF
jgi:exodeoxyribonuclease-1